MGYSIWLPVGLSYRSIPQKIISLHFNNLSFCLKFSLNGDATKTLGTT